MTQRIRSFTPRLVVAAFAATLAACSSDSTAPLGTPTDAALAAQTFTQLADSVARSGGDADAGAAYSGIAGLLRMGGRITPIALTIDGKATTFMAAAMSVETISNVCPPGAQCFAPETHTMLRSLIAWDKENPKRLVQLSSASNDEPIAAVLYPSALAIYAPMASLIYLDGAGGTYFGISGQQGFSVTKSATPCASAKDSIGYLRPRGYSANCVLADIAVKFDAKLEPAAFLLVNNLAKVQHSISMAGQTVAGTHQQVAILPCDTSCYTPGGPNSPTPPVVVRPSTELPAALSAKVDSLVTLTFTVKNPSSAAIKVTYPSGQKYDFVVIDSTTGRDAWRWSADKSFLAALVEETVPAGGALTFTASWKPLAKGKYLAHGLLVSTSHRAEAYAAVVVP